MSITPPQFQLLSRLLDSADLRHRVIAQNLANVNTPGYREQEVSFEAAFARALQQRGEAGAVGVKAQVVAGAGGRERADGNNVDIDQQMGSLTRNALLFNTVSQLLTSRLSMMRDAITSR